ncbi:hypothetical protein Poli38472_008503 [Pythium oligandrum]|uniref:Uncharacterized protein n=1 Tax=Pythium oligandrum TaxID=41045 RepID=A0A8K1C3N6_PYTOL|nr:hypothetical protein Poli38472_008503 [Pythium oligandrum]|eukprot:TMW55855.1 hypothetical protein Poli38472_008503 [Pythium oligandrum]
MDVGTEVWVKCNDSVWTPGVVLDCQDMLITGNVKIKLESGEIVTRRYFAASDDDSAEHALHNEIFLRNKTRDYRTVSCLIGLEYLHEPALLHALSERFNHDRIYTSIGDILLAVNPFKDLDLYSDAKIEEYKHAMVSSVRSAVDSGGAAAADPSQTCDPHVFAIAGKAFSGLLKTDAKNQAILVSGESGSGKTESTKFLMKFLTSVGHEFSSNGSTLSDDGVESSDIIEIGKRILQTNPILESFGNAQTIRNDNSSRFGKFIKIQFDGENQIIGAEIASYLLEKVRLIHQSPQERNFHIFYELLEGADAEMLTALGLERGKAYELLNAYGSPSGTGAAARRPMMRRAVSPLTALYSKRFQQTVQAFQDTGVEEEERTQIFEVLAALLHLGNVNFCARTPEGGNGGTTEEAATVTEKTLTHLEKCASLLGISLEKMESLLLTREITAGKDLVTLQLNADQSKDASRSFAKAIYGRLFTWLVSRLSDGINFRDYLAPQEQDGIKTIGILDIFGFESLEQNGFEQMCINYANERLQSQFNEFVFIKEQDIYVSEGIDWRSISYPSNAACLALFDEKSNGLFSLLDQECLIPKGSNQGLSTKYYRYHGGAEATLTESLLQPQLSQKYIPLLVTSFGRYLQASSSSKDLKAEEEQAKAAAAAAANDTPFSASKMDRVSQQFVIRHFAGKVCYKVDQFLEKNQDSLPTDASHLLQSSSNEIVACISATDTLEDAPPSSQGRPRSRSRTSLLRAPSVSAQFRGQLDILIDEIGQTEAHYIRCLKPNEEKKARLFDRHRMVEQLRSVGVLEALRIARAGYSARLSHDSFVESFSCYRHRLVKNGHDLSEMSRRDVSKALLALLIDDLNAEAHRKATPVRTLLRARDNKFNEGVREYGVQLGNTIVFCKTAAYNNFFRLRLNTREHAAREIQRMALGYHFRLEYASKKRAAVLIQAHVRGHQARRFVARLRALQKRVSAYRIQRCMRAALVRLHEVDEKIRVYRLSRVFQHFRLGCTLAAQRMEEVITIKSVESTNLDRQEFDDIAADDGESTSVDMDVQSSDDSTQAKLHSRSSSKGKLDRVEGGHPTEYSSSDNDEQSLELQQEIQRLQQLLLEQKRGSSRRVSRRGRAESMEMGKRQSSRRTMSVSGADELAVDGYGEYDDQAARVRPRRAQSVSQAGTGESEHVSALTRRIEELDAKCRLLERLVSRPGYESSQSMRPPLGPGWGRRRYSFANSDASSEYPHESVSGGGGSSAAVESLIWSIQQQMDMLRHSVASKTDEEAAMLARHEAMYGTTKPMRSSTVTSNGSSAYMAQDGVNDDARSDNQSLPSPARTNSEVSMGYNSSRFSYPLQSPLSESSFRHSQTPRVSQSQLGINPFMPRVVKWSRSTQCHECQEPFTIFVRRHHCRMCGSSFCHEHSSRRVTLYGMGFDSEPQRVCDPCFAEYHAQATEYYPGSTPPSAGRMYPMPSPYGAPPSSQGSYYYAPPPASHPPQRYPSYYSSMPPPHPPMSASRERSSSHTSAA